MTKAVVHKMIGEQGGRLRKERIGAFISQYIYFVKVEEKKKIISVIDDTSFKEFLLWSLKQCNEKGA